MAQPIFITTIILLAVITGTNSESFKWNDYDVTRETTTKDGVKNFTQSLSRTLDGITTVDRTVTLTKTNNNKIISVDHSITTTNKGIVTFDRTLEKFNTPQYHFVHDHFFNTSKNGIEITGRNFTTALRNGSRIVEYLESAQLSSGEPTFSRTIETYANINKLLMEIYDLLIFRANDLTEVIQNITVFNNDGSKTVNISIATVTGNGNQSVDFSVTEINKENKVTYTKRIYAIFRTDNTTAVDTKTTTINLLDNSKVVDQFITTNDENGGEIINQAVQHFSADGTLSESTFFHGKIDIDGTISNTFDTDGSRNIDSKILRSKSDLEQVDLKLGMFETIVNDLLKLYVKLIEKRNILSEE